jgi:sugar lactone lactonase YvrE
LALDASGNLYAGYDDGRVIRFDANGGNAKELANTAGRPLGHAGAANRDVDVADAMRGLMRIGADGVATVLSVEAEGLPFKFVDDVDITADGSKLYFSDASSRFGFHDVMADVFEHGPNGRVLEFDVASGQTRVLMRDLHFANGVTMGPGDEYLLVNDMNKYRVLRHWLRGDKAGTTEVFIDNLPGFPDNINFNGRDRFWLALYTPRIVALDRLLPNPQLRKILFRLPKALQPAPVMHGWVVGLDLDGKVVADLQYASPDAYAPITSAVQSGDSLYLGSLLAPAIGRLSLSSITN